MRSMTQVLDYMLGELEFRLTPLPLLCRKSADQAEGNLKTVFLNAAAEMDKQNSDNAGQCFHKAVVQARELPFRIRDVLEQLGNCLGNCDLSGQLRELESVKRHCVRMLEELEQNKQQKTHNYQTLALCAGAALAILFI